jgi:hypothetical protein
MKKKPVPFLVLALGALLSLPSTLGAEPLLTDAFLGTLLRYCRDAAATLPPEKRLEAATLRFNTGREMTVLEAEQVKRFADVYSADLFPELSGGMSAADLGGAVANEAMAGARAEILADPELDEATKASLLAAVDAELAAMMGRLGEMDEADPVDLALFQKYRADFDAVLKP